MKAPWEVHMHNILICDDEKDIVSALKIYLSSEGYKTFEAYNGREALEIIGREEIHLVLLDVMMPEMDGISALSKIREKKNVPVILLTAKSEDTDKVLGLNIGADDYVTKPFNPVELIARVRSQLRRYTQLGGKADARKITVGRLEIDNDSKTVTADGEIVSLTPKEYDILRLMMENLGVVFSPKEIYRSVWGDDPYGSENTVAVHIRHLREKLEIDPADPRYLKVVWGHGYKIEKNPKV
jgi:DNA-binding response OmpR family regulator